MNVGKLHRLALVLLAVTAMLASGCSQAGTPAVGGVPEEGTPSSPNSETPLPANKPKPYSTRELALKEIGSPTALWDGKIIYNATTGSGEKKVERIVEHDLATGREAILIEAQPPHTDAVSLRRSGDWLFYYETHSLGPWAWDPPRDYYAFNLRSRQRQYLLELEGTIGTGFGGSSFGDNGFAYIRSSGAGRLQLHIYSFETGDDRLLLETESADHRLGTPMLRGDKVFFQQSWQTEWPPDVTPTPVLGRPGPPPRYQRTGDIFSLDLKTGRRVNVSKTGSASQPAIWGDYLMWIDSPGGSQEHGSGEVYVQNSRTGQLKKLTNDATYMHLYSSPMAGDGFFVWGDAHLGKDKLPVYLPESDEIVYLEGPGSRPRVDALHTDGRTLFWSWQDTTTAESGAVDGGSRKVYMTTFG